MPSMGRAVERRSPTRVKAPARTGLQGGRSAPANYDYGALTRLRERAETSEPVQRLATLQRRAVGATGSVGPPVSPGARSAANGPVIQRKPPTDPNIFTYEDADGSVWQRDSKTNEWCHPGTNGKIFWDDDVYQSYQKVKEKAGDRFTLTFVEYLEKQLEKAEKEERARIPVDLDKPAEVAALYGTSRVIDPAERVPAIKKMFTDAGYEVSATEISTNSSSDTPPHLFDVTGHTAIFKFEVHPGGGIHASSYIRISTNKGMIKVINTSSEPPYKKLGEKAKYVEVSI